MSSQDYQEQEHGGLMPVPVHVISVAAEASLGTAARRRKAVRTELGTETVDNTNPVRPLLPAAPNRVCAYVQVTGGDVYLCDSTGKANSATPEGSVLPSANTAPWPVRGQNAVWVAQKTAGTTCVVSFTADYDED